MQRTPTPGSTLDALVVGAGPAGVGTAIALGAVDDLLFGVVERGDIGQTFHDWPTHQRFLTPSFTGNGFGATDLNSVHFATSPAYTLGVDYPTGAQYARYLTTVARHFRVPVMTGTEVTGVDRDDEVFVVRTSRGPVRARTLVWATGEYSRPRLPKAVGSGLLDHSSTEAAWALREGRVIVVGGNESGMELACHHVERGSDVLVLDPDTPWDSGRGSDPSQRLSPRTRIRLAEATATGRLELSDRPVRRLRTTAGSIVLSLDDGSTESTPSRPIAATGYSPAIDPVGSLFALRPDGLPELTEDDESTITPGLFLAGPSVRHQSLVFCFVYKFRQRFAHVAGVIAERTGHDRSPLEEWRENGMLTDDLSCCGIECAC
ncbi:NAD(P)-binding domain-containing protein [Microcella alkalica]|nr:NAD(P)/FAD-dependent oxidoreductase [Microcella alkalica]